MNVPVLLFVIEGGFQLVLKVLGADGGQDLVAVFQVLELFQLHEVREAHLTDGHFGEDLLIQLHDLQAVLDRVPGEAGFLGHFLHALPEVEHHLEALCLLIDRQIGPLHVFQEHGLDLLLLRQIHDGTGQRVQSGLLRRRQPPVADDDGIAVHASVMPRDYGQVLQHALGGNAVGQLRQISEVLPGVIGMRIKLRDRNHGYGFIHGDLLLSFSADAPSGRVLCFQKRESCSAPLTVNV